MRENVVDELQQAQPDDKTKQKMLDILKRFHSEEKMDSMDEDGRFSNSFIIIIRIFRNKLSYFWKIFEIQHTYLCLLMSIRKKFLFVIQILNQ